jgi:hypothetical protein
MANPNVSERASQTAYMGPIGVGTVIGNVSTDLVAFYGATAIVRPSVSVAATDAATALVLANSLRTALVNLGIVA